LLDAFLRLSLPDGDGAVARLPRFTVCVEFCNIICGFPLGTSVTPSLHAATLAQLTQLHVLLGLVVDHGVYNETADNMEGLVQLNVRHSNTVASQQAMCCSVLGGA